MIEQNRSQALILSQGQAVMIIHANTDASHHPTCDFLLTTYSDHNSQQFDAFERRYSIFLFPSSLL
jgi:hypothetical protein